ncbi:hypothetical protein M2251_000042 [Rhodococcus erythropolis]|nr:hypothetical protein [Rhodococcus erythropolis]
MHVRQSTSPVVTDHPGYDEAAGTEKVSSGFTRSVPVLRLSASGRSKRHFWAVPGAKNRTPTASTTNTPAKFFRCTDLHRGQPSLPATKIDVDKNSGVICPPV